MDEETPIQAEAEHALEAVHEQAETAEEHTEAIKEEVAETPAKEIDEQWKSSITNQLETLSTEIRELKAVIPQPSSVSETLAEETPAESDEVREIVVDPPKAEESKKQRSRRLLRRKR